MSSDANGGESPAQGSSGKASSTSAVDKQKEKARVSKTSQILWHAHQNDAVAVRKLLEEDRSPAIYIPIQLHFICVISTKSDKYK
ncbi:hypothetical protein HRI_000749200 [Hibiscus trionum]|uniref:Uncharacterized protein n=1 Tax=Hibiscus trionum TaxID=183268 RepID=A0A9W7H4A1_HIBTR|nr:hypothetical protein HRI_000749200 [Hibiscus trionum]